MRMADIGNEAVAGETDSVVSLDDIMVRDSLPDEEATIFKAIRYNDTEMIARQFRDGVDVSIKYDGPKYHLKCSTMTHRICMSGYTPLHVAVLHSLLKTVEFLVDEGSDVNIKDAFDRTPLHLAVIAGRHKVIAYLINKGADLNAQSSSGRTALHEATLGAKWPIVRQLVSAGAKLDLMDLKGTSVLMNVVFTKNVNTEILEFLLNSGCDVNQENGKGATALFLATGMRDLKTMKILLKHGANINQADINGCTPFHLHGEEGGGGRTACFLIHSGADINCTDKKGRSPLMKAVKLGNIRLIMILLKADCNCQPQSLLGQPRIQELCERVPPFRTWLETEVNSPRTLKRLCRQEIRTILSPYRTTAIPFLEIPTLLKDFLLAKDV
ncbi:hypothetical protein ACJMK2_021264 [Sinanodonta woodiana]|uniref:SOCS box domain-containing protein n=2 Tax=Sinanodonta woodiana TaxID=1069815 RepID=A0ABD3TI10_SINWO